MASATERPLTAGGERRRHEILRSARRIFLDHGYHASTTRMIAAEAGVSEALLYRYFPSKRDLFDAVVDDGLSPLEPYLQFGAPMLEGLRLREMLEAAAYTTIEIVRRDRDILQLLIAENRLLQGDRRFSSILDELHRSIADRIDAFAGSGEARPCNSLAFSRQLVGGIAAFELLNSFFGVSRDSGLGTDDFVREVVDSALASLSPRDEP